MSISVSCPNGHALKVKDDMAGKSGLCPVCKAPVKIPAVKVQVAGTKDVSEDAIMGILGSQAARPAARNDQGESAAGGSGVGRKGEGTPPKKSCYKCHQEISAETHICPHCHTYIANLGDF